MNIDSAAIVGYGSAGRPFTLALKASGIRVESVADIPGSENWSHALDDGFSPCTLDELQLRVGLVVLAVRDADLSNIAERLAGHYEQIHSTESDVPLALHLSGRYGVRPLIKLAKAGLDTAAFHPIQTFPPDAGPARLRGIYAGITAEGRARDRAWELARLLSVQPLDVPEAQRARYHLASVMVSNFLPLLLEMGTSCLRDIAGNREEGAEALFPLMEGMLASLHYRTIGDAMTGPVVRDDLATVRAHLNDGLDEELRGLYRHLTSALVELAVREGRLTDEQAQRWRVALAR